MRRVQVVCQKAIANHEINTLTDAEQDQFIREVAQHMTRELRERTRDAMPLGEVGFQVQGPYNDPIQGLIHVHTLVAEYDMDTMHPEAQARLDWLAVLAQEGTGEGTAGN